MMAMTKFAYRVVYKRKVVDFVEISRSDSMRLVNVRVAPDVIHELALPVWYFPSTALLSRDRVGIWAGTHLAVLNGRSHVCRELGDEIHGVFAVGDSICVVTELSVQLCDAELLVVLDRYDADDALGSCWWEGPTLCVQTSPGADGYLAFVPSEQSIGGPNARS